MTEELLNSSIKQPLVVSLNQIKYKNISYMEIYFVIGMRHDTIFFCRIRDHHVVLDACDVMKMCKHLIEKLGAIVGSHFKRGETEGVSP